MIEEHNAKNLSYKLGINAFADLTGREFKATHLGLVARNSDGDAAKLPFPNYSEAPDAIDWVQKGAVTPIKDQGKCGSCWAFSSTGALEGALFVAKGQLVSLSEEQLSDCETAGHGGVDYGCFGGLQDHAFAYVAKQGLCTEKSWPYTSGAGVSGKCSFFTPTGMRRAFMKIAGYTDVNKTEDALKLAVAHQPVSVGVDADSFGFKNYKIGVMSYECGTKVDHGILVVGYGSGKDGAYWKIKNSWGTSWGESGYGLMIRGKNMCGINTQASFPIGATLMPGQGTSAVLV